MAQRLKEIAAASDLANSPFDFTLPALVAKNEALAKPLLSAHVTAAFTLAAIVLVHIAAALQHHFIRRDETLRRMLPGGQPTRT